MTVITKVIESIVEPIAEVARRKHLDTTRMTLIADHVSYLRDTVFLKTSPVLSAFSRFLATNTNNTIDELEAAFTSLVPVTEYSDYAEMQARIVAGDLKTPNLLCFGIPTFIISSSSTSGGKSKLFACNEAEPLARVLKALYAEKAKQVPVGTKQLAITSLAPRGMTGDIPICSVGTFRDRIILKSDGLTSDEELMDVLDESNGVPHAIKLAKKYNDLMALHALFALVEPDLGYISTVFSSTLVDWIELIQQNKQELLECIRFGTLPKAVKLEQALVGAIVKHWIPNPARAQELEDIDFNAEGWMKIVWQKLEMVEASCSGVFATRIPEIRHAIGSSCKFIFGVYASTEGFVIGVNMQTQSDPHLFQILNIFGLFEYLEVGDSGPIVSAAKLKEGQTYKLIVSNKRLGLWRYNLQDLVQHVGYHPVTNNPIVRYIGRDGGLRLVPSFVSEQQLRYAADAVFKTANEALVKEFVTFADNSEPNEAVGFCFEATDAEHILDVGVWEDILTELLRGQNERFEQFYGDKLRKCVVRVLRPGTFAEYRAWRAEAVGSGQVKIPVVIQALETKEWFLAR
ncbi:hypothetical protein HDU99_002837, partial [Rhizoclosmatium hyalinum]